MQRADKMLVDLLRTGSASATEARQLLTQIDNRQAIITVSISSEYRSGDGHNGGYREASQTRKQGSGWESSSPGWG